MKISAVFLPSAMKGGNIWRSPSKNIERPRVVV
jgi:hypothetical protein